MKINLKQKKGITLIALVVTIIVLIILASVSMTLVLSNDGIIAKAKNAKEQTLVAQVKDEIQLKLLNLQAETTISNGSISNSKLEEIITNAGGTAIKDDSETITGVQVGNTIIAIEDIVSESLVKETTGSAAAVKADPTSYYGKIVTGYTCAKTEYNWQIYYSDGNNIYITTTDYIKVADCPNGKKGTSPVSDECDPNDPYQSSIVEVARDYDGASDITDTRITSWLSCLKDAISASNFGMKETAYLLDTSVWNTNFKGEKADYAIGGPTLELFCASYKDTHPNKYVEFQSKNGSYEIKLNTESEYDDYNNNLKSGEFDDLYLVISSSISEQYIASPHIRF